MALVCSLPTAEARSESPLRLALANSTCEAMRQVGTRFSRKTGIALRYVCKSSGRLAKGLRGEAIEADYFVSANKAWMDKVVRSGLIAQSAVTSLWGNELVVAVPRRSPLKIDALGELASDKVQTIFIGTPSTTPFGRYTKQALQSAGLWRRVRHKITTRRHITLVVETLENADAASVGILFRTSLRAGLARALALPERLHEPVRYYSGPLRRSTRRPGVLRFARFLSGKEARRIFGEAGFILL